MLQRNWKHLIHCSLLLSTIVLFVMCVNSSNEQFCDSVKLLNGNCSPVANVAYLLRLLVTLALPQGLFNFFGLVLYDAFPEPVILRGSPMVLPLICVRIVTRGDYPALVRRNVLRNMNVCLDAGLENFYIEVVTDRAIHVERNGRTRELVVPRRYRTNTGALFKARALQYCLEDAVNVLKEDDWIVHLDEETLLTADSVKGIMNFILDGRHPFGQGVITYANEPVVNWLTTLADCYRVADDMGKLRLQLKMFHTPLFGWKGSFVVSRVAAEKDVSFDHGPEGSVAEDCFFAMRAFALGYTFNFVEGQMLEKSPFTLLDFLRQRKRWLQGILLVVRSSAIPLPNKFLLGISLSSWITLPLSTSNLILAVLYPVQCPKVVELVSAFVAGITVYMYLFGVTKSLRMARIDLFRFLICSLGAIATIPMNVLIENVAVIWGIITEKNAFYVIQKDVTATVTV